MGLTAGQTFLSIGGAVIGGVIGGFPGFMIGMSLGGIVGGWIDPPDAPDPPPYGDLGINSFVHNAPVPIVIGCAKVYGGCIWLGTVATGMDDVGGKKSPEYEMWMTVDFAIGHCEGEVGEIVQYFVNDKTMDEAAEDNLGFNFTSYLGTSTQTVDPTINAFMSGTLIGAVPFKNTCYTVAHAQMKGGYFSSVPTLSAEINGLWTETGEEDANPVRAIYNMLIDDRIGLGIDTGEFDGDPDTIGSTWYTSANICDENVSYIDGDGLTVNEPRYRYSNTISSRQKAYDIINGMLFCCNGILSYRQGKIIIRIETGDESIEGHFSSEYIRTYTTAGGSTINQVNFNTSFIEVDGFWEGAYGKYTVAGQDYEFCMLEQGTNYIVPCEDMSSPLASGIDVTFKKDNIKEGTFTFNKTELSDTSNRIRVEFLNRKWLDEGSGLVVNEYAWDTVESDSSSIYVNPTYGHTPTNEVRTKQVRVEGIKRKSQATRLARFLSDYAEYNVWYCEFTTDIYGIAFSLGDVVTITHPTANWLFKEFRIINIEELEIDEVKIICFEYNRTVYNDYSGQIFTSSRQDIPNPFAVPDTPERFNIWQDDNNEKRIYIAYKVPDNQSYWSGVRVYVQKTAGGDFNYVDLLTTPTYSVKLSSSISDTATTIPFDSSTLYGSFETSGWFYIDKEKIYYTGISGDSFTGCVRGDGGTIAVSHGVNEYCNNYVLNGSTPYINFASEDIGATWTIKLIGTAINGLTSDWDTAPTDSLTIQEV